MDSYADAGADAVLVHGTNLRLVMEACQLRKRTVPLVLVPTKYPEATTADFASMGAGLVIFANQALRAAVSAMQGTLSRLCRDRTLNNIEGSISPLDELFRLAKVQEMRDQERRYEKPPVASGPSDGD